MLKNPLQILKQVPKPHFYVGKTASRRMAVLKGKIFLKGSEVFITAITLTEGNGRKHAVLMWFPGKGDHTAWRHWCSCPPSQIPQDFPEEVRKAYEEFYGEGKDYCWRGSPSPHIKVEGPHVGCKHCEEVFLKASFSVEEDRLFEIIDLTPSPASTIQEDKEWWRRYLEEGYHILLWGPPGEGKTRQATHIVDALVEEGWHAVYIDGGPHVGAKDLLGGVSLRGGNTYWREGSLLRAFRLAEKGEKVVILIDELPRIPLREQGLLIAPLYPKWIKGQEVYLLTVPELGIEVKAPRRNLWVVATGNLGETFQGGLADRALEERFRPIEVKMSLNQVRSLLEALCKERGFSISLAKKLTKVREKMERAYNEGLITNFLSFRQLEAAVRLARKEEEVVEFLRQSYRDIEERAVLEKALQGVFT